MQGPCGSRRRRRKLACAAGALAVLAGCGPGGAVVSGVAQLLLPSGSLTAAIHVFVSPTRPRFSGYLAGHPLSGVYSPGDATLAAKLCPGTPVSGPDAVVFTYTGSYDGQPYTFGGCIAYPASLTTGQFAFRVEGRIGPDPISGSTTWPADERPGATGAYSFPFKGTIGSQSVTGTALVQAPSSGGIMLVARLTVH